MKTNIVAFEKVKSFVSSTHPLSNLRLIRFATPQNETVYEREYRESRTKLQQWNHEYWQENNAQFYKAKEDYTKKALQELRATGILKDTLSQDELSPFYRSFLDSNYNKHVNYNKEWYRRHIKLLKPGILAFLAKHSIIKDKSG